MSRSILSSWVTWMIFVGAAAVIGWQIRTAQTSPPVNGKFRLSSPEVVDGGILPKDYTGDGTSSTLPLEWSNVPAGTRSFALIMHHVAPDRTKCYWIIYDIPPDARNIPKNVRDVGHLGMNNINTKMEYAPPHSKGPGTKLYVYTLYALSSPLALKMPPEEVTRETLLNAMKRLILDTAELHMTYTRFPEPSAPSPIDAYPAITSP